MGVDDLGKRALFLRAELRQGCGFPDQTGIVRSRATDARSADRTTAEDPRAAGACTAEFVAPNAVGSGSCGHADERCGKDDAGGSKRNGYDRGTEGKTQADGRADSP